MRIKQYINEAIDKIQADNTRRTVQYKARLKQQLAENLIQKKQSVQANAGLIRRFYSAAPQPLNQMQQAMQEAAQ